MSCGACKQDTPRGQPGPRPNVPLPEPMQSRAEPWIVTLATMTRVTTILAQLAVNARRNGTSLVDGETWAMAATATMTRARTSVAVRALMRNQNLIRAIE